MYVENCQVCGVLASNGVICRGCLSVQEPVGYWVWDRWEHEEYLRGLERASAWHNARGEQDIAGVIEAWRVAWAGRVGVLA